MVDCLCTMGKVNMTSLILLILLSVCSLPKIPSLCFVPSHSYISLQISYSFEPNHLLFPFMSNKIPNFGGKNTKQGRFISPRYPYIRPKYTISNIPLTVGFQSSNKQFQHSSPSLTPVTWAFPLYSKLMTSPHTFLGKISNK